MIVARLTYEESLNRLRELGILGPDEHPQMPLRMPQPEDAEPLGLSFFRTLLGDGADLSNLTLPRTFFGRSEVSNVSFVNTELSESNFRWNDFIDVDFTDADLIRCDFRSSIYERVSFVRADLRGADMRRADFSACNFDGATVTGVVLTNRQAAELNLSNEQRSQIVWTDDEGPDPSGG